jgi:hypothetical protein
MGLAGLEHGIGEILQGNTAPQEIMFPSWPDAEFFSNVAGEPAMSIIPNLLVTGILTCCVSLLYLLWATRFVHRKHAGQVMILLAIIMLLVGGGMFPPVIGIFIGVLATRINRFALATRIQPVTGLRIRLSTMWPWCFGACLIGWLLLFPGSNLLSYFLSVDDPNMTLSLITFALGSLVLTVVTGLIHDRYRTVSPI